MTDLLTRLQGALGDRYRIAGEVGSGGMGLVFLAEDVKLGRKVALKVLRPEFARSLGPERFLREIRIAAQLDHPNVLSLIDSGEADGFLYYVMFYVEGESLRDRLNRERQLPLDDALAITREVAEALDYAHRLGVIHRDIKPENILFKAGHAMVADFGIARAISEAGGDKLTETGLAIGTPAYMSPEQATASDVDARSDLYSLGCVLYEMLAGDPPHAASTAQAILARKTLEPAPSLGVVRPTVPAAVDAAVRKALATLPADRVATGAAFVEALSDEAFTYEPPLPTASPRRRRWLLPIAALGTLVIIGSLARFALTGGNEAPVRASFTQLTALPGVENFPSLSPDGMWLVYTGEGDGNRDVFLRGVGGQLPINLTEDSPADDSQPVFSPDGERIAFRSSREGGGIFVMGRTGEAVRRVTGTGFNPAWSPDGTKLAFATERVELTPLNWEGRSELWVATVATGEVERLSEGDGVQPSWSPGGNRIAYTVRASATSQMDIWTMPAAGGEPNMITNDAPTDWSPVWSPDGRYIYFASDRGGSMNLWRIPVSEESGTPLDESQPVTAPSTFVAHPSLSADGRLVAFSSVLTTQNIQKGTLNLAAGRLENLTWLTTGSRSWSSPDPTPDGQRVAFYSRIQPEGDLYVIRGNGTGLRQLTADTALDRVPRWSPDGTQMTYFSNRSGRLQLWAIRADGSGNRQLTGAEMAGYGVWSPDGSRIAVNSVVGYGQGVVVFDPGRDWSQQTPEALPPPDASLRPFTVNSWSPDGGQLAGQIGYTQTGVVTYSLRLRQYERLTDVGEWPVWLADSRHLLFVHRGKDFFVVDSQTKDVRKVFSVSRDVIGPPRVTRDGRTVLFSRRVTEGDIWLVTLR